MVSEGFAGGAGVKNLPASAGDTGDSSLIPDFWAYLNLHQSVQFSSVTQSCPTLCDPMDCSTPGLPVYHQLPELTQTHVHWVSDGIQPSHPLSSPSPPTFNLSQHQDLFKWVSSLHQEAKVLAFQLQHQSFQWISMGVFKFSENLKGSESFRIQEKQSILSVSSHHRFLLWSRAGQCSVLSTCLWLRSSSKSCRSQRTRRDLGLDVPSGQLHVSLEEMPASFSPPASCACVTYPERRAWLLPALQRWNHFSLGNSLLIHLCQQRNNFTSELWKERSLRQVFLALISVTIFHWIKSSPPLLFSFISNLLGNPPYNGWTCFPPG